MTGFPMNVLSVLLACVVIPLASPLTASQHGKQSGVAGPDAAAAQQPGSPVHWRLTEIPREPLRPGVEFPAAAQATIAPGWHLYALDEPEDGPLPLEFSTEPGGPVTLVSVGADPPERGPAPGTSTAVNFYRGQPRFRLRLRAGPSLGGRTGQAIINIRFQACNDRMCLPPHTARLTFPLRRED